MRTAFLSGVLVLIAAGICRADVLEFRAGGTVEVEAEVAGETVVVRTAGANLIFMRGDFRRIAIGPWPPRDWPARRAAALRGDADARYAAARWALEHGLTPEGLALLRATHANDPGHAPTAHLVAVLDHLDRPCGDPDDLDAIERILPGRFEVARSPHLVLFHQHEEAEARQRLDVLERVVTTFYLEFAALGIDLDVPAHRLVMAWFADRDDYQAYLDAEGADGFRGTRGYHQPTRGVVASYDARSDADQRQARAALAKHRATLARLSRREAARSAADSRTLERLRTDTDRRQLLVDLAWSRLDIGSAAHELVHRLVAVSGLAPRYEAFPNWLHEGLAMQFEPVQGGRWAGLQASPSLRLADWRALYPRPALAALLRDEGLTRGYRRDPYAAAWAWVGYLRREEPAAWQAILDRLRLPDDGRPAPERARAALLATGDRSLLEWEREWQRRAVAAEPIQESGP
jgi:hypothetical protein